ncbi:hypothetical protein [Tenacibaculum dicentrarchi]|uniref:Cap15 family cyclic dinucleotide receptor domain-containing protein n=1 Tax=Tenacibaculum dicentrarchi TaxID=669041 RepID=UPI0035160303
MKNINLKYSLYIIVGLTIVSFLLLSINQNITDYNFKNVLKLISQIVTIITLIIGIFVKYLWKYKIFKSWLVPFPNLNGTWKGYIHTTWIDPKTNQRPSPIPVILTIEQSFSHISCVMRTSEMSSVSIVSDFHLDKENQIKKLYYSYDSNPLQTVKERSPQHCGTMAFNIVENSKFSLNGEYWTGRKTTGEIKVEFWKKDKLDYFPENLGNHPVSEIRENKN